jgi:hypothetical protein
MDLKQLRRRRAIKLATTRSASACRALGRVRNRRARRRTPARAPYPEYLSNPLRSGGFRRSRRIRSGSKGEGAVSSAGLRIRPRRDFYALRFSDDATYDFIFLERQPRKPPRSSVAGSAFLRWDCGHVHDLGVGGDVDLRAIWGRAAFEQSVGQWAYRSHILWTVAQLAGGLRDYSSFGFANQIRPGFAAARYYWRPCSRIALFLDVVRLHWTVRGNPASIVHAGIRVGTSGWHGSLCSRARDTFLGPGAVPSVLAKLPRSGSWLARAKIIAGFIILAVMFKYLASVDQVLQLHLLSRERFLAIWFALSLVSALYLFGQLRLPGSHESGTIGLGRVLAATVFVAFAMSLLPGMFGANLGEIESFLPQPDGGSAQAGPSAPPAGPVWIENDLAGALSKARNEHKTLLVSFSGYACTNCHWMKANLFPRAEVALALQDFVLVELYTDGTDEASKRNQAIEESRFSTVALPFSAVLDSDERVLATRAGLVRSSSEFLSFLHYYAAGS